MIKGLASLVVTKATVIAALQQYFNDCTAPGYQVRVEGITMESRGSQITSDSFSITLVEQPVKI